MSQAQATSAEKHAASDRDTQIGAPDLSLSETLRVLEVARQIRQNRSEAEVALARKEIREMMRKRLLEAAAVTGDRVSESDIDAAIDQYFHRLYAYKDPPFSFSVLVAHLYVRRHQVMIALGSLAAFAAAYTGWLFLT